MKVVRKARVIARLDFQVRRGRRVGVGCVLGLSWSG